MFNSFEKKYEEEQTLIEKNTKKNNKEQGWKTDSGNVPRKLSRDYFCL